MVLRWKNRPYVRLLATAWFITFPCLELDIWCAGLSKVWACLAGSPVQNSVLVFTRKLRRTAHQTNGEEGEPGSWLLSQEVWPGLRPERALGGEPRPVLTSALLWYCPERPAVSLPANGDQCVFSIRLVWG